MNEHIFIKLKREAKACVVLVISEIVFNVISKEDIRYTDGRETLDMCWSWVETNAVSGDELYELIDNADFTGISEFIEDEEDLNISKLWSLLVDAVAYISWEAYQSENVKFLPQSLEGINNESIITFVNSAFEAGFISLDQIQIMEGVIGNIQCKDFKVDELKVELEVALKRFF